MILRFLTHRLTLGTALIFSASSLGFGQSAPSPATNYAPIDLAGTYLAARNEVVGATTDSEGIGSSGMVQEPSSSWRFTPFNKGLKKPSARDGLDLRGKSFGFDVDLGEKNRWPNPNSLFDWFAGNAADGHEGSTLVIRAAYSDSENPINVSDMNGLRILFYRKDGKFFGHVDNLWYSQDVDLPGASVATKFRVQVDVASSGAIHLCFKQMNGAGAGTAKTVDLVGGSTDHGGLTSASFLVQMANVTRSDQAVASATKAMVSRFWTSAGSNSLYAFCDQPYQSSLASTAAATFGLYAGDLAQPTMGYRTSLKLTPGGSALAFSSGQYENTALFEAAGNPAFAPNGNGRFDHSQHTNVSGKATQLGLLLESLTFLAPQGSANTGRAFLRVLPTYANTGQPANFVGLGAQTFSASAMDSNGVVVDPYAPTFGSFGFIQDGAAAPSPLDFGSVTVTLKASDVGSGLADHPLLNITLTDNHGVVTTKSCRMGSYNPINGTFGAVVKLPLGTATLALSADVSDRAGNTASASASTPVFVPDSPTLTMPIHLNGYQGNAGVSRLMRIVLGRKGGDGRTGPNARVVINKVVTFDENGDGTVTLTHADGLPEFPAAGINQVWVKDPFHTLGNMVSLKLTGSTYSLKGVVRVNLIPGDVNNSNVIDGTEYSVFTTTSFGTVDPNTTTLADTGAWVPAELFNLDLNADGKFDQKDVNLLNKYFGQVGDEEPENYF